MLVKNLISIYVSFFLKRYNFKNDLEITKNRNKILKQKLMIFFFYIFWFWKRKYYYKIKKKKEKKKDCFLLSLFHRWIQGKRRSFFFLEKEKRVFGGRGALTLLLFLIISFSIFIFFFFVAHWISFHLHFTQKKYIENPSHFPKHSKNKFHFQNPSGFSQCPKAKIASRKVGW